MPTKKTAILKMAYKNDVNIEKQILNASPAEIEASNNIAIESTKESEN